MDDDCPGRSFPRRRVDDVAVVLRDDGTNRRARLQLTYSAGAGPATVFAKAVDPEHADLVALTSGLYHEPRLFSSGVVLPLDHPTVYTAIIDEDRRDFLMIMEDVVSRGALTPRLDPADDRRPGGKRRARACPDAQRVLGRPPDERPGTRHGSNRSSPSPGLAVRPVAHRPRAIGRHRGRRDPCAQRNRAVRRHLGPLHRNADDVAADAAAR